MYIYIYYILYIWTSTWKVKPFVKPAPGQQKYAIINSHKKVEENKCNFEASTVSADGLEYIQVHWWPSSGLV